MQFIFPDSQDQIDPSFDFQTEERNPHRVRQRDDLYAHEALRQRPFDGILVSKPIVDGLAGTSGRYTVAQRERLYRQGIHRFLRLDRLPGGDAVAIGDCGAFTYVDHDEPPYTPDEVVSFYDECGFDAGMSVDHVILGYEEPGQSKLIDADDATWRQRQELTLQLASEFLAKWRSRRCAFEPIGVAQGWSPESYAASVAALQKMGFARVALGGMVPLKTRQIDACLKAVDEVRNPDIQVHLLGVTRTERVHDFARLGVSSFDSTSPFLRAFKDETANYWTGKRQFTALRVPQVDANPRLKRRIGAGEVNQEKAVALELECLRQLDRFDGPEGDLEATVEALASYERVWDGKRDRSGAYRETLDAAPWRTCPCGICGEAGIHVATFRGAERNKRRGFHNVYVFNADLQQRLGVPVP